MNNVIRIQVLFREALGGIMGGETDTVCVDRKLVIGDIKAVEVV